MQADKLKIPSKPKSEEFLPKLDFYWKSIAGLAIALIIYSLFRGSIEEGALTFRLIDPVVILLTAIILFSAVELLINAYKKRIIIVGRDFITFKTRNRERRYGIADIVRIYVGREKFNRVKSKSSIIKIRIKNRKRIIRIRPSSYWNGKELVQAVLRLKKPAVEQ